MVQTCNVLDIFSFYNDTSGILLNLNTTGVHTHDIPHMLSRYNNTIEAVKVLYAWLFWKFYVTNDRDIFHSLKQQSRHLLDH